MSDSSIVNQSGLEWVQETFGLEPRWTIEPNIESVKNLARKHLQTTDSASCEVDLFAQGGFNKIYRIRAKDDTLLLRVSLPVDPCYKVMSEVATIQLVREKTGMPVPRIFAFDASSENELGFEWILMEMMPGQPLRSRWRKLTMDAKQGLVKFIARYQAQLFRSQFSGIGNIFEHPKHSVSSQSLKLTSCTEIEDDSDFVLGRIVSLSFFWGDHIIQSIPRGPFAHSRDWLHARLTLILNDQERILRTSEDEDDIEDAENAKNLATRLVKLIPHVFPSDEPSPELSIVFHDDLSLRNILVDESGKLTGIIDWECVSALPLWKSCQIPHFLEGRERDKEPLRDDYGTELDDEKAGKEKSEDDLDNEGICDLYWEHLLEYEQTQLRKAFLSEMEKIAPLWVETSKKGALRADFERAVLYCDDGWHVKILKSWLDDLEDGKIRELRRRLIE
ncbi:MAG: hypothetical protein Q9227_004731 [Pyrenula ochraceoflavens]